MVQLIPDRSNDEFGNTSLTVIDPVSGFTPRSINDICPTSLYNVLSGSISVNIESEGAGFCCCSLMNRGNCFSFTTKSTAIGPSVDIVFNTVCPTLTVFPTFTCDIPMVPSNGALITE